MKIKAGIPIGEYPPKLKELAILRAQQYRPKELFSNILSSSCIAVFLFSNTPEGSNFWSNVNSGREFDWQETTNKWGFKPGDEVINSSGLKGRYVRDACSDGDGICLLNTGKERVMSCHNWKKVEDYPTKKLVDDLNAGQQAMYDELGAWKYVMGVDPWQDTSKRFMASRPERVVYKNPYMSDECTSIETLPTAIIIKKRK